MADRLALADQDLAALATGKVIVAFAARHAVDLNDELELVASGPRPATELSGGSTAVVPIDTPPVGLVGLVIGLQPAASLAGPAGSIHHGLADAPEGDAVILRVFDGDAPVLSDAEFDRRRTAVEALFT